MKDGGTALRTWDETWDMWDVRLSLNVGVRTHAKVVFPILSVSCEEVQYGVESPARSMLRCRRHTLLLSASAHDASRCHCQSTPGPFQRIAQLNKILTRVQAEIPFLHFCASMSAACAVLRVTTALILHLRRGRILLSTPTGRSTYHVRM